MTIAEDKQKLEELAASIGVEFSDFDILTEALTHRSYLNEMRDVEVKHNERLEFLGDAVLELLSTKFLFHKYPTRAEGELTSFRAALVRTESLAEDAVKIKLGDYLYMSKGEAASGGRKRPYILANAYEALIGSIYLHKGLEVCEKFLVDGLFQKVDNIVKNRLDVDAKSKLQELSQEVAKLTPAYELKSEEGPDHDKIFTMVVMIGDTEYGSGSGRSKQEAEQNAASQALQNWTSLYQKQQKFGKIANQ